MGGASILIIVSVVLDTTQQINAQLQMREYEEI
jgi:preprotein translocase subunit SecY